jgi:flagellar hook-associated protein 3 FlgL
MRITEQTRLFNALQYLRTSQEALAKAEAEVATGRRVRTVSDDPTAAAQLMRLDQGLRASEQFRRSAGSARTRLAVEDEIVTTIRDLIDQARGLALGTTANSPTDPTRQAALSQVNVIIDQVIALGNTKVGNEYIFAGSATDTPPFQPNGTYVGDSNVRQVEIDEGILLDTNHAGDQLLGSTIQALQALATELQTGTGASIQATASLVMSADLDVLASQAEVGLRQQELDWAERHMARRISTALDRRDELSVADPAESAVRFMMAQAALERAREVITQVMSSSLLEHLR